MMNRQPEQIAAMVNGWSGLFNAMAIDPDNATLWSLIDRRLRSFRAGPHFPLSPRDRQIKRTYLSLLVQEFPRFLDSEDIPREDFSHEFAELLATRVEEQARILVSAVRAFEEAMTRHVEALHQDPASRS